MNERARRRIDLDFHFNYIDIAFSREKINEFKIQDGIRWPSAKAIILLFIQLLAMLSIYIGPLVQGQSSLLRNKHSRLFRFLSFWKIHVRFNLYVKQDICNEVGASWRLRPDRRCNRDCNPIYTKNYIE